MQDYLTYSPDQLLVSIHIPKCGGTSFTRCLESYFNDQLHLHYPDEPDNPGPPEKTALTENACVHGHFFHHRWPIGALDYYPDARQFITLLRDPFEMTLSGYYFQRRLGDLGDVPVTRYLDEQLQSHRLLNFLGLPFDLWKSTSAEIQQWLSQRFLFIGITERFEESVQLLSRKLNRPMPAITVENASPRTDDDLDMSAYRQAFQQRYSREYALYHYANQRLTQELEG